jgi:hypothetical protein
MSRILAIVVLVLAAATWLRALPNQVFFNGFQAAAGMPFEDFIAQAGPWDPAAPPELPGDWTAVAGGGGAVALFRLKDGAAVFGIPARAVTIRREHGRLTAATVDFAVVRTGSGGTTEALRRNLAAWAEIDFDRALRKVEAHGLEISIAPGDKEIQVTFRRVESTAR